MEQPKYIMYCPNFIVSSWVEKSIDLKRGLHVNLATYLICLFESICQESVKHGHFLPHVDITIKLHETFTLSRGLSSINRNMGLNMENLALRLQNFFKLNSTEHEIFTACKN